MNILQELERFNDVYFREEDHSYHWGNKQFTSATTHIKRFQEPFNEIYWAKYKQLQANGVHVKSHSSRGIPQDHIAYDGKILHYEDIHIDIFDILSKWKAKSDTALANGKQVHADFEKAWFRKLSGNKLIDSFVKENKHLIPIRMEYIVADYDAKIAGQLDGLFFNKESNDIELIDYKTDEEIKYSNRFTTFLPPLEFLSDCNFNKYTLQLNFYKHCIEKYTSIRIARMYILNIRPNTISRIDIPDCPDLIKLIL